jgi:hypothetical protein
MKVRTPILIALVGAASPARGQPPQTEGSVTAALGSLGLLSQVAIQDHDGNYPNVVAKSVQTLFGPGVQVSIVPAPSALALLGLGTLIAGRRRGA